ncbi:unnamed protein product, partial [Polarella glacialis]
MSSRTVGKTAAHGQGTACNLASSNLASSCSSSSGAHPDGCGPVEAGEGGGELALVEGVAAVIAAMAGEVRFANESEDAFALLRRGCRHCASRGAAAIGQAALRQVPPEQQVV